MTDLEMIAERIVSDLFTNGIGEKAHRLVLESDEGRDLGGWVRSAVRDRIGDALKGGPTETGALLAEVERRYPETTWHLDISRMIDAGWHVSVSSPDDCDGYGVGTGETFTAALRDLLGVDGG